MEYSLGLDIGTTSVKAAIIESDTRRPVAAHSIPSNANIHSHHGGDQDVSSILIAVDGCIEALPSAYLARVTRIGVCGQMHGVCMWRGLGAVQTTLQAALTRVEANRVSNLYTWMDARCDPAFLAELPKPDSHLKLATGHGCATLFWLQRREPELLEGYEYAGTVMDLVVSLLTGSRPLMSPQNAAGWGYFNTTEQEWNIGILHSAGFPTRLLPAVTCDTIAGNLHSTWNGIPAGVPVGVALGDLQCSVLSTHLQPNEALINISTSAQVGHIVREMPTCSVGVEHRPYFHGAYFAVGASLNGGNVLAAFVDMLRVWCGAIVRGPLLVPDEDVVWARILEAAAKETDAGLQVIPTIYGERHAPDASASVAGINSGNTGLGQVTRALCRGIVQNLVTFMPLEYLHRTGIKSVVLTGSTFSRNPIIGEECEKLFTGFGLRVEATDAAVGAAIATNLNSL